MKKQEDIITALNGGHDNVLIYGPSQRGKSFGIALWFVNYALVVEDADLACFRSTLKNCKATLFDKTFKEVLRKAFPSLKAGRDYIVNKADLTITFTATNSIIRCEGLDDEARLENILGHTFDALWFEEATQFSYKTIETVKTRLSGLSYRPNGQPAPNPAIFSCNPTDESCYLYKMFEEKVSPNNGAKMEGATFHTLLLDNDNEFINTNYEKAFVGTSYEHQERYRYGRWLKDAPNATFNRKWFQHAALPPIIEFDKIVIAVDPAVTAGKKSDMTGIIVAGRIGDEYYIIQDATAKLSTAQWGQKVVELYDLYKADFVIAETNNGGDLVVDNIRNIDRSVPVKKEHTQRGKQRRIEGPAALFERGEVFFGGREEVENFEQLKNQLMWFGPDFSERKKGSPDRADAMGYALKYLSGKSGAGSQIQTAEMWGI